MWSTRFLEWVEMVLTNASLSNNSNMVRLVFGPDGMMGVRGKVHWLRR